MRSKIILLVVFGFLASFGAKSLSAQEEKPKSQLFVVHQDFVKPSMTAQYEKAIKELQARLTEHKIASFSYATAMTNDFHYLHISPIKNMAQLDQNPFADLEKAMGEEASKAMWKNFDGCLDTHINYILSLSHELSYNPQNVTMMDESATFRHWTYFYIMPDKEAEAAAIAKEWHDLYQSKNIPSGYRLYIGDLGTEVPLYLSVQWAKSPADFAAQAAKNNEMLGKEGEALMARTMAITRKLEEKDGWMRLDLSYTPAKPAGSE